MREPQVDLLVVEQMDPTNIRPGGIEGMVSDLMGTLEDDRAAIIGLARDRSTPLGQWRQVQFGSRRIWFMAVARFPEPGRWRIRVPHSLLVALGLLRYHPRVVAAKTHLHRAELGALWSVLRRTKYVQFLHNDSAGLLGPKSDSVWKHFPAVYRLLERRTLRKADAIGLFNRTDGARIRRLRPDVVVLQTWFKPELFYPPESAPPTRPDGRVHVLWAGRYESQKDPMLAVEVGAHAAMSGDPLWIDMAGEGSMRPEMEERILHGPAANVVELLGAMKKSEVAERMRHADVLLLTSHYEGSPTVLIEANACGLPVVSTDGGDPDRAIAAGRNGVRVPERDAEAIVTAIRSASRLPRGPVVESARPRSAAVMIPIVMALGSARRVKAK